MKTRYKKKCPYCGEMFYRKGIAMHIKGKHKEELHTLPNVPMADDDDPEESSLTPQTKEESIGEVKAKLWRAERKESVYREALLTLCKEMITLLEMEHQF